jgi:hypothetical protein
MKTLWLILEDLAITATIAFVLAGIGVLIYVAVHYS